MTNSEYRYSWWGLYTSIFSASMTISNTNIILFFLVNNLQIFESIPRFEAEMWFPCKGFIWALASKKLISLAVANSKILATHGIMVQMYSRQDFSNWSPGGRITGYNEANGPALHKIVADQIMPMFPDKVLTGNCVQKIPIIDKDHKDKLTMSFLNSDVFAVLFLKTDDPDIAGFRFPNNHCFKDGVEQPKKITMKRKLNKKMETLMENKSPILET